MKRGKAKVFLTLLVILIAGIYYYVTIPAVNIHASGFWTFILTVIILLLAAYGIKMRFTSFQEAKNSKVLRIGGILLVALVIIFAAGSILSSPIVNAKISESSYNRRTRFFKRYPAGEFQSDSIAG